MKGLLGRTAASTALLGRTSPAGGARWFSRSSAVEPSRFQEPDEPHPGHWRRPPAPWSADVPAAARVSEAVSALPGLWRSVLWARDGEHRPAGQVARALGLTTEQERRVLDQARATVREHVARCAEGRR